MPDAEPQREHQTPLSLLERARARDPAAWRELVDLYRPLVLFWCRRGGLGVEEGEDLCQEVFAAVALNLSKFHRDRPGDTFRGWLRVITRNQILLLRRRLPLGANPVGGSEAWLRLQAIADPLAGCEAEEEVEFSRVCGHALERVRRDFEDRTWQAFWRTVVEGRTPAELADQLGMSPAGIRQAKSRILRRLKQEVGELLE